MLASPLRYGLAAGLVLLGLAGLAAWGERLALLPALVLLPLVAAPAMAAGAYGAGVRRAHALAVWAAPPVWARLGPRYVAGLLLGGVVALLAALSVGLAVLAEGWWAWARVAAIAALLFPVARLWARRMEGRRPFARLAPVLVLAPATAALVATALGLLLAPSRPGSLAAAVAAAPRYEGSSALVAAAVDARAIFGGARAWAEGRLGGLPHGGTLLLPWRAGALWAEASLAALAFAPWLLPGPEWRRALRPSDADEPPPVGPGRLALAAGLLAILGLAVAGALAEGEAWAAARAQPRMPAEALAEGPSLAAPGPEAAPRLGAPADASPDPAPPAPLTPTALRAAVEAERLGELLCAPGTLAGLDALEAEARALLRGHRAAMEGAAREAFGAMRARVPPFLDGYYSLSAEYLRTLNLLAGQAEGYLEGELREALGPEAALAPLEGRVAAFRAEGGFARIEGARAALLRACSGLPSDLVAPVVTEARDWAGLAGLPAPRLALEARLAGGALGGVAGSVAGAVAGKVVAKLLAKEAFGLAAEALVKLGVGRAAGGLGGAAVGAATGGAAGSVVPGLGTTVGAVVGGILGGLAVGVATDAALLSLEEALSRDRFEADILQALDEAEAEVLAALGP